MASKFPLSEDQQSVVDSRDQNVAVFAAAGSGKTRVLTERITSRVTDREHPIDIDRILVVTFTTAAAREMKERVGASIGNEIAANPHDSHLQKQASLIHKASISTIDSFCLDVVRNHFHRIELDPSVRPVNEGERTLIMQEAMDDVIKRAYASKDRDFYHVVDCYAWKSTDDSLEKCIIQLFNYASSHPYPKMWLEERKKDYAVGSFDDFLSSDLLKTALELSLKRIDSILELNSGALRLISDDGGPKAYNDAFESDRTVFEDVRAQIADGKDYDAIREAVRGLNFKALSTKKSDGEDPDVRARVKALRDTYKKDFEDLKKDFFFDSAENLYTGIKAAAPTVDKLISLTIDFMDTFAAMKIDKGVIDFGDMEHFALNILIKDYDPADGSYEITDVAEDYRNFFEEIMVDEYQDSNEVQELILQSISRENTAGPGNRFMVGDIKQSIYSFRMARPAIFMAKQATYSRDEHARNRIICLKNNYRSRDSVINSVNRVFLDIMTPETGGVAYDDDAMLYRGGTFTPERNDHISELVLVEGVPGRTAGRESEARAIVRKIKEMSGRFQVQDKDGNLRPSSFRDFAVLFRYPARYRDIIKDAFEKEGVPYHLEGTGMFYDTVEVKDVISFLEVLNNPLSDISLYASLTSFFGGFNDEECARINSSGKGYYLWDRLTDYHEKNPDDLKVNGFIDMITAFREAVRTTPIDELLIRLYDETGYRNVVAAMPDGKQRLANINLLLTKAGEYAKTSFHGLFHFLRYIELIRETEVEEGEANIFDEQSDTVRIMSIHKSKGLEFPVCIIGGMNEGFNFKDASGSFISNLDAGIGAYYINPKTRVKKRTLRQNIVADHIKRESLSEEIRVLYVAMTRAKEKLIMTGTVKDPENWFVTGNAGRYGTYLDMVQNSVISSRNILFKCETVSDEAMDAMQETETIDKAVLKTELETGALASKELEEKLRDRFAFTYPKTYLSRLYTKTTVSKLKLAAMETESESVHPFEEKETNEYIPSFAGGEVEVKGTDRGTAYHGLLQLLEFKEFIGKERTQSVIRAELDRQIEAIRARGSMSAEDIAKINLSKITAFLMTDVAYDMGLADREDKLFKEQPFVIGVKASTLDEEFPDDETILVQGVIDVYYIKDDRAYVLDYKTDRVNEPTDLVKRYRTQLDYYAEAIAKLTGYTVEDEIIYSFGLESVISVLQGAESVV